MGFKNTLELITKDIQDIENLVSNFQNSSKIPAIELDLTLSKLQNVYELMLMIREHELNDHSLFELEKSSNSKENQLEIKKEVPVDKEINPDDKAIIIQETREELSSDLPEETPRMNSSSQNQLHPETKQNQEKIISEKYESQESYINEKFSDKDDNVANKIQSGPIQSISGSIGINEKFFFIRELFNGNAENFRNTLSILDGTANFNEAYNHLSEKLNIDMENKATQELIKLLHRKFISTENE